MSQPLIAVIGDVHGELGRLGRVLEHVAGRDAQGLLLCGDLACAGRGERRSPERIARWEARARAAVDLALSLGLPLAWVPGNHDLPEGVDAPGNADGRLVDVAGLRVAGLGGAGPERFGFAYEWDDAWVRRRVLPEADVLLFHAPPRDTPLDRTARGEHVGSAAVAERVRAHRGVFACGHIHEAPGVHRVGDCLCLNAGGLGEPFGRAQVGFLRGVDAVWHEDIETGRIRALRR